jgi:hypothetical protein
MKSGEMKKVQQLMEMGERFIVNVRKEAEKLLFFLFIFSPLLLLLPWKIFSSSHPTLPQLYLHYCHKHTPTHTHTPKGEERM